MARRFLRIAIATLAIACHPGNDWYLEGKVRGPLSPSAPDRTLVLAIVSSNPPTIAIADPAGSHHADCNAQWREDKPYTCVLPPGAKLMGTVINGHCPTACQESCDPPSSARLEVTVAEYPNWTSVAVLDQAITIPPPVESNGSYAGRQLELLVDTASKGVSIKAEAKIDGKPYALSTSHETWNCHRGESSTPKGLLSCRFNMGRTPQDPPVTPTIHFEAIAYGRCPSTAPCSAPSTPEGQIRIASVNVN